MLSEWFTSSYIYTRPRTLLRIRTRTHALIQTCTHVIIILRKDAIFKLQSTLKVQQIQPNTSTIIHNFKPVHNQ